MAIVLTLLICCVVAVASPLQSDAKLFCKAAARAATSPLRASSREWLVAGGIAAGLAASSALDRTVRAELAPRRKVLDYVSPFSKGFDARDGFAATGHLYDHPLVIWGGGPLVYSTGLVAGSSRLRRVGMELTQAVAMAGTVGAVLKATIGRSRPFTEQGPYHFVGPNSDNANFSFPSGDTNTAFAFSTVLAQEIHSWPLRIGLYALATATAFQRLDADRHWLSDVLGGAVVGTGVGVLCVRTMRGER